MMARRPTPESLQIEPFPFEFTGKVNKVVFDTSPHLTDEDRQAINPEQDAALRVRMGA